MSPEVISLLGILIGLAFLIVVAYKGLPLLFVAPISALIVILISGMPIMDSLKTVYMPGFTNFATKNFLLFLLSALFGKLLGDCGAAKYISYKLVALARKFPGKEKMMGVLSLVFVMAVLTLGGISLYVVVFTLVAIAKEMFEELDIPWSMYTCGTLGSSTFTMSMIPGNPSVQNLIPIEYLGTTATAGPVLGLICSILCVVLGLGYIHFTLDSHERKGEGFLPSGAAIAEALPNAKGDDIPEGMNLFKCLVPSICLLVCLNLLKLEAVIALTVAVIVTYILFLKNFTNIKTSLATGCSNALSSIGNVCAVTGFGAVVAATSGYAMIVGAMDHLPGPPIFQLFVAVNVISGATGSASGGLGIALGSMGQRFIDMGIDPQIIHRVAVMSSGGLDSLPHNGSVINNLTVTRLGHKYGYKNYFVITVLIPLICAFVACILASLGVC